MITVTIANFLAVFITLLGRIIKRPRTAFWIAVVCLVCFYGIRTDYGNDIPGYIHNFERISQYSYSEILDNNERFEPGWLVLNVFFAPFGWQIFVSFLTIIQIGSISWLISKYVKPQYYWLIFLFFVFNANLLMTGLSMLRQSLAMSIVLLTIPFILRKKYILSVSLIMLATTMHTSAYCTFILILFPWLSKFNWKALSVGISLLFLLFKVADLLVGGILNFVLDFSTFEVYETYAHDENIEKSSSGLFAFFLIIVCIYNLYNARNNITMKLFSLMLGLSATLTPFATVIPAIGRIQLYFILPGIISYSQLPEGKLKIIGCFLLLVLMYVTISGYFAFFESPVWKYAFGTYHTILD